MKYKENFITEYDIQIIDGDRGKNYPKKNEFMADGHTLFLNNKNLISDKLDTSFGEYISAERDSLLGKGKMSKGDIVLTTRGSVGNVGFYSDDIPQESIRINSGMVIIRNNDPKIFTPFLYLFLRSNYAKKQFIELSSGSVQKQLPIRDLKKIRIVDIPMSSQEKFWEIINSIDTKIELNNQMIATLEELAATLFKRWFVDFEFPDENGNPYKSSGGKMVDSELGEIPEGWEVGALNDIGNIVGGGTPSKKNLEYYEGGEIPWITPKDLSDQKTVFISKGKVSITPLGLQKSSAKMIPEKSILFSSRAPIGYIAISRQPVSTNQGFKSVVPINSRWSVFIYLLLQYSVINIESRATGSTFKEISGTAMKNFPIIIPTKLIIDDFSKTVNPIFHKIDYIEKEVRSLEKVRNILLPKLLSGEIEV